MCKKAFDYREQECSERRDSDEDAQEEERQRKLRRREWAHAEENDCQGGKTEEECQRNPC